MFCLNAKSAREKSETLQWLDDWTFKYTKMNMYISQEIKFVDPYHLQNSEIGKLHDEITDVVIVFHISAY